MSKPPADTPRKTAGPTQIGLTTERWIESAICFAPVAGLACYIIWVAFFR